jgi:diguanylate cyclase (GGDEF)-like protein/PAS domain S-box-containing protein
MNDSDRNRKPKMRKPLRIQSIDTATERKKRVRLRALKLTLLYLVVGCLWILFSDKLAAVIFKEVSQLVLFSIIKGLFYVAATAVLFHCLIYPYFKKLLEAYENLESREKELGKSKELYKSLYIENEEKRALLKALINTIPDSFFFKNTEGVYISFNKTFEKHVGKPENEIIGKTDLDLFGEEKAYQLRRSDLEVMKSGQTVASEGIHLNPDGSQVYLETLQTPFYDAAGNIRGIISIGRDITGRKMREEKIQYLSYHDILTGLYNRSFFQEECKRLDTTRHLPLSVIVGDVNGLKLINDTLGHAEGDKLLKAIAEILKSCCRKCDIVARTGGDEFAILLPKTGSVTVQAIVDRIKEICNDYSVKRENNLLYTNIALGCATKYTSEESLDKIITIAEDFMYRRKLMEYKSMHSSILSSIKTGMSEKNYATKAHADRLSQMSRKLGEELGLPERIIDEVDLVSTLHDIGKISLDVKILNKPAALSDEEWREIRKHPEVGFRIANATPELRHLSDYILCHHERWDGKGYPQGLSGEDIPLISRIIAITDAFDAMTQDRPYRKALSEEAAAAEIEKNAGTQFDPNLAEIFIRKVLHVKNMVCTPS